MALKGIIQTINHHLALSISNNLVHNNNNNNRFHKIKIIKIKKRNQRIKF